MLEQGGGTDEAVAQLHVSVLEYVVFVFSIRSISLVVSKYVSYLILAHYHSFHWHTTTAGTHRGAGSGAVAAAGGAG